MEHSNATVDNPELSVLVQVGDDAGDDSGNIEDVEDGDGDEGGCEETPEVSCFPILDDDHEK